jgi:hypothetical protein
VTDFTEHFRCPARVRRGRQENISPAARITGFFAAASRAVALHGTHKQLKIWGFPT